MIVYALDESAGPKKVRAVKVLSAASRSGAFVTSQVLGELCAALTPRAWFRIEETRTIVTTISERLDVVAPTTSNLALAMRLTERHGVPFWDAMMICVAAHGGCTTFITEDFQDGRRFAAADIGREPVVVNPFDDKNLDMLRKSGLSSL